MWLFFWGCFFYFGIDSECSTARKRRFDDHDVSDDNVSQQSQPLIKRRKIMNANELILNEMNNKSIHKTDNNINNSTNDTNNTNNTKNNNNNNETKQQTTTKKQYVLLHFFCFFVVSWKQCFIVV